MKVFSGTKKRFTSNQIKLIEERTSRMEAETLLQLIEGWEDPNPAPVLSEHEGILVVRDDHLGHGSKVRFLDYLIGHDPNHSHIKEWVFGSCPATGYAQISLPVLCNKYGKKAVLFMAKRDPKKYHEYQKRGIELGAVYNWVPDGMLNVTQARAREYAEAKSESRKVLPIGLEHPTALASIIKVARSLDIWQPDYVWSVGSSGTLNRGLQLAFPQAEVHVVSVGHTMSEREIGRAIHHKSPYKFDKPVKGNDVPPFPSAPTYDAKAWAPLMEWKKGKRLKGKTVLLWNVAS